ncbi:MAG: cation transporter [Lachnospiraceae bacterium]|nr:cation transporter [Lachnospiraceae bacterium]MBQ9123141.1 cation transporter [Lachnospiraceae bacterium]
MIRFLINQFIGKDPDPQDPIVRQKYGVLSGWVGICFNLLLFAGKLLVGILSNSIAILADAFNNLSDAGSSIITLIGFKIAGQKPDSDHPFGHGRLEYISGLLVSLIIIYMGIELVRTSFDRILHPQDLSFSPFLMVILLASIAIKFYMYIYNRSISRKIKSAAMMATAKDSLSDTISTFVVLICTLLAHYYGLHLDGLCGIVVGVFILYTGYQAAKETIDPLLGQAPDPEFVAQIEEIVMSSPVVIGIHDLIVHNYGPGRVMISVHAEVPADGDILVMHDAIDVIEHSLREKLHCHAVIHMDPICVDDPETISLKEEVTTYIKSLSEELSLHDFRLVKGPTHTNVIFDLLVPYDFTITDAELIKNITSYIQSKEGCYFAVIEIDKKYA